MDKKQKTNVMRALDAAKISYEPLYYEVDESDLSGVHAAELIGYPPENMFKTLAALGDKTGVTLFCLPVALEVDTKKAAAVSGNKKISFLPVKELLATVGYVRGACSPIGTKKRFPTYFDDSCLLHQHITISAGMRGCQLIVERSKLLSFLGASTASFTAGD